MSPDPSGVDQQHADVVPAEKPLPATEVEYALILSQMIELAEQDPSQLRLAVYEFARTKLIYNTMNAAAGERERLSTSLESAIAGVEKFSRRRHGNRRMVFRSGDVDVAASSRVETESPVPALGHDPHATLQDAPVPRFRRPNMSWPGFKKAWSQGKRPDWFAPTLFLLVCMAALVLVMQRTSPWRDGKEAKPSPAATAAAKETAAPAGNVAEPARSQATLPLPTDYGVYAINGPALIALQPLASQIPDKRIEMSTPITQASNVFVPDSAPKFVIYRRDFSTDTPDQVDVRAVARVARVIKFDPRGKPVFAETEPAWIIRNVVYDFRVRPIADHPEMFLVQPKDVELPSGRYVIVLKNRGYDFNVEGKIDDPAQCVERTDAVNGSFYSDCRR